MSDFTKQRIDVCFHLLIYLVLLFVGSVGTARISGEHEEASFYGESYTLTPVEDANNSTSISLFFRTRRARGLLLLAAGESDYIIIQLNAGIAETRVNLGSGEAILLSARGVRLDDSRWHELVVNRTLDSVYVTIDGFGQGERVTPGPYHNLNIDLGVFLGGSGKLKRDVYRDVPSFRGCLKDVFYNGMSVLEEAKNLKSAQNAFQVSWHCDEDFFAHSDSPISFSSDTSFVAFPYFRILPFSESVLSFDFKTRSENAILFFNSGKGRTRADFIAVELVDGRPKLSVDKGSGVIETYLAHPANDGKWHRLEMSLSQSQALLMVDSLQNRTRFSLGGQSVLNLAGHMYVGGVGMRARPLAIKLGLASIQGDRIMKGSILGCIKNIEINKRSTGFQQIQISRLISPECGWDFPCSNSPCLPEAKCIELEGPEFRCDCNQQVCVKDKFKSVSLERNKDIDGILSVQRLEAAARSSAVINESNINLNSALRNIADDIVTFTLMEQPKMGSIEIRRSGATNTFSLKDLKMGRIFYRHRGGSSHFDTAVFQVTFDSLDQNVETKIKEKYEFVLPIHIKKKPLGKKIKLVVGYGNIVSITSGAKIQISKSILDVEDVKTDPGRLAFQIDFLRSSASRFERISEPERAISTFTFQEVLDGSIWFVHGGDQIVYTTVVVSDGPSTSDALIFRFKVEELKISTVNNTGLLLDYGSSDLITFYNLSSVPNVEVEKVEMLYHITHSVSHGAIQKMDIDTNQWMDVESFTQDDVNAGLVRYIHLPGNTVASYDEVWFEILSKDAKTSPFAFSIRFKTVTLFVDHEFDLVLHQILYIRVTSSYLSVKSNAESLDYNKIIFTVHRRPRKGYLYFIKSKDVDLSRLQQGKPLIEDDQFTQQDVNNGHIYYRFDRPTMDESIDFIDLHASYYGFIIMVRTRVVYHPTKLEIKIINEGLDGVMEGGFKVITEDMLAVDMDDYNRYTFSVLHRPKFGEINVKDVQTSATIRMNTTIFTMIEILDRQVVYLHDDSEHDSDSFTFSVIPIIERTTSGESEEIQEIIGTFHIQILMRNDNAPVRTINKVFHVARGQSKRLTIEDLAFKDPDIDFDSSQLLYHARTVSNGYLLKVSNKEKVSNFTQRDLEESNLLFQNYGVDFGRAVLVVSDGKFFSDTVFEVQALDPYIVVTGNTEVVVRKGQSVVISGKNLSLESNLDFDPSDVTFNVLDKPKSGYLTLHGKEAKAFSYHDVKNGKVVYVNTDKEGVEDFFRFSISVNSVRNESYVYIRIIFDGLDEPPEIIHNQILEVTALHTDIVTENFLCVGHKDYMDDEIEFIITKLPERGYMTVKGKRAKPGSAPEFTQQEINEGLITYTSETSEISFDSFIFDVTTEYQSLRNMEFLISVIPQRAQIQRTNISVSEGGKVTLVLNSLYFNKKLMYSKKAKVFVEKPPVHGQILLKEGMRQNPVNRFSISSLSQGSVSYRHDNSDTLSDQFSLLAESLDDVTLRQETFITVTVEPVDDQPPKVIVNTGLNVWTGSLTLLTNKSLQASDPDSKKSMVRFEIVSHPNNGHLAYLNNTFRSIRSFTQEDVDSQQIVFVHKGTDSGEFRFQATDSKNKDQVRIFQIHAKQVRIILDTIKPIQAFPNFIQPITNSSLLAMTSSSNYTQPIMYAVIHPFPSKGRVVTLTSGRPLKITSFSQDDINQGKVFYQHREQMRLWDESDSIRIEITSTYAAPLRKQIVPIQLSFSNLNSGNYRKLLGLKTPSLPEGDKVTISKDYFNSDQLIQRINSFREDVKVEFSFASPVSHGSLWFKDMDAEMGSVFTQDEINNGDLVYNHDHTESTKDMFQFAVKILVPRPISKAGSSSSNIFNFTVRILPVNDMPFTLITRDSRIKVTQGLEVTITPQNLSAVDLDTGPEGIEYVIIKQPDNGKFVHISSPTVSIDTFTQQEINEGSIVFKHDGSRHGSSIMKFKVWDRKFHPYFSTMEIEVIAITIAVSPNRSIPILQGKSSVYVSSEQLKVSTNGDFMSLKYKITQQPQSGKLFVGNSRIAEFSQHDIEQELVLYVQDVDSSGDDFFVCDIQLNYIGYSLDTVQFDITVKPLVKQGPLLSAAGSHVAITRASLDASELAQITNDNPRFDITVPPKFGQLMMKNRQRRNVNEKYNFSPVSNFTFEDVLYNKIYFVAKKSSNQQDSFSYVLSAKGVPPAKGKFIIQLEPTDETDDDVGVQPEGETEEKFTPTPVFTSTRSSKDGKEDVEVKGVAMQTEDDGDNSSVIIAVVLTSVILIILVIVLVVIFMRWRGRQRGSNNHNANPVIQRPYISGPLQLEQPHVFIEPHLDNDDSSSREEDTALMSQKLKDDMYVNTSHINKSHDMNDTSQWLRAQNNSVCKTSPVFQHSGTDETSEDYERSSMMTSGRESNASADLMEWTLMDPDLLQHCYNSQPVLRNNQYWL